MGNLTSSYGNNYPGEKEESQTLLNLFVEKTLNDNYLISNSKYHEDSLNVINASNDNDNNVLLKRAVCTNRAFVPVTLPYDYNEATGEASDYSVNIHATHFNKKTLTDDKLIDMYDPDSNLNMQVIQNIKTDPAGARQTVETSYSTDKEKHDALERWYNQQVAIENDLDIGWRLGLTNSAKIVGFDKCRNFYTGFDSNNNKSEKTKTPTALSFQLNDDGTVKDTVYTRDGFCGKLYKHNVESGVQDPTGQLLGKHYQAPGNGEGNQYITPDFVDCNCLNNPLSKIATENQVHINQSQANKDSSVNQTLTIDPVELAQQMSAYCNTNDNFEGDQGAYISKSYQSRPIQYCYIEQDGNTYNLGDGSELNNSQECKEEMTIQEGGDNDEFISKQVATCNYTTNDEKANCQLPIMSEDDFKKYAGEGAEKISTVRFNDWLKDNPPDNHVNPNVPEDHDSHDLLPDKPDSEPSEWYVQLLFFGKMDYFFNNPYDGDKGYDDKDDLKTYISSIFKNYKVSIPNESIYLNVQDEDTLSIKIMFPEKTDDNQVLDYNDAIKSVNSFNGSKQNILFACHSSELITLKEAIVNPTIIPDIDIKQDIPDTNKPDSSNKKKKEEIAIIIFTVGILSIVTAGYFLLRKKHKN